MWFLNQFEPSSAAYNRPTVLHFQGRLDITILERSLNEILRRHQVLRTVYRNEAGRPIQEVREAIPIEIAVVDLQGGPESAREAEAERLALDEVSRSFTLSEDLMFRAQIIRFAEDNHWLILTTHHIAFDGWSQGILHDELAALYAAFRDGKASPLPELPLQYIDYATRQRDWAIGSEASQLLEWWKCTLQGAATVLELPSDYSRPSMQLMRGARSPVFLAKPLTDALCDLATRNQASLFMVLMAAWNVLLHRYTGQEDILVGFPIAGRTRRETEPLIGLFMNSLPLRTNLAGNPKFRELLSRVREMALAAYSRQDVPLQLLIESMSIQRDTSRVPLFHHMFVLQNAPLSAKHLGELSFDSIEMNTSTSKLDLTMVLRQRPEGLEGCIEYSTDLFENATIERMAGHFITLLEGIVATPDQRISQLPLLTEPERHQLLVEFNDTACEYPRELCVHELFEQQVQRTPDAVALVFEDQQLTYAELNARANRLARYLRSKGVGIETPVGMCLERSLDLVVSILGILKAGGTYVPLDAEYPKERTLHMIENSKVYAILTQRSVLDRISYLPNPLCVEQIQDASNGLMETAESIPKVPVESIAYVIHTSGSTGIPKGVAVSQSSLVNLLSWANGVLFTDVETALMGVAPATFDISLAEFLAPLLEGKTTVFTSKGIARDPVALIEQIALQNNCVVQATPATWVSLLDIGWNGRGCRTAVSTGEALPSPVRSKLLKLGLRVLDLYGPTETTIWSTYREVHGTDNYSCIGRPIANTQVYVLDSSKQLVPVGVPGELYIGGDGLAQGYLNRPDLTAERFVPNPFSQDPHSRLYRTGDRCRWRADGNLEYLGRIDHQVKLRGFRIELGEIESTLANHSSIAQCVVILREDRPGDKRLVAYYTASGEIHPSIAQLREHLQASLPEYMIPSAFVRLDALPLTPSGKIDRRALPVPDMKDIDAQEHYTPPRNGMEEELVEIWQEILGIERIGIHDNFFALGGHSLLAVRLTSRVLDVFDVQLGVRQVFENPSIAKQAQQIEVMRSGSHKEANFRLRRNTHEVGQSAPLSHAQERLWFLEQLEGSLTAYNIPMSWRIHGTLNTEALRKSLEAIVLRHKPLRTTFKHDGTMPVQIVQQLDRFELPVMDLRELDPSAKKLQLEQALLSEANGAFDLSRDVMLRSKLLRLEDNEHEFLLTMHHIASDGWSIDVLSRELSTLYRHFRDAPDGPTDDVTGLLDPLPVNYIDYTLWQRQNLSEHRIDGLLEYWQGELKDVPALELPTDRPRPSTASYQGSSIEVKLPEGLISKLESLCSSEQVTLQMLLLAAFESLLYRYSHQEDFAVGIPFAGREDSQLEDLIGFFVSTLVIRADLSGEPTFQELLSRVRQKSLAAYDHQALPLQVLLAELQPERHLSRPPLFQVMFQLLSRNEAGLMLQGLKVTHEDHGSNRVKFDLELHLSRHTGDISGSFRYSTELFDSETIQRMALHYVRLLESIAANPNQKVSQLEILTDQERTELLVGFNDTATDYPKDLCVHELFEQQVQRTPDAVALVFEDQQLTYSELNTRANRLARYLRFKGVGIETPVGMCLERSLDLVVSILGILKAGASYVPLDAGYPTKRLEYMLKNARIEHLVTYSELLEKVPKTDRIDICIDTDTKQIANQESEDLDLELDSGNLAYVIFTSGSTGEPKGVMIEHRSIARLVFQDSYAEFGRDRVLLQLAPISFDASTFELWGALLHGAKLVIPNPGLHDGGMIQGLIRRHGVTTMWLTSSLFNQIVEDDPRNLLGLDELLTGGEALSPTHVKSAFDSLGNNVTIVNGYGPTESTTFACCYRIPSSLKSSKSSIPIGRPISNTQAYILDASQQLVPMGILGELYIGGDGLARGYLNRPDLTAERFVPNPFSQDPHSRLYRTGDRCRWRADGNLEYLGRIDNQVKLRGFRIELGEIESTLASHPAIAQCVVILREDRPRDKRLVAYYTASGEIHPSIAQLREHLQASLPEYMIPSAFVRLDALPLTPSGKIDRRALPVPDMKDIDAQEHYTPPRNGMEEELVEIWQEILGIERIGIHDNFFSLGGHSLLAVQLFNTINQRFQKTLPLSLVFQRGSIAQLASSLVEASDESAIARVVRLSSGGGSGPKLIVMPGLHGQVLYALKLVERLETRFDIYGLEPNLSSNHLETFGEFRRLASEYLKIILKHQPSGPYNFVGYCYGGILGYEIARQLQQRGHRVDFIGVIDTGPNTQSSSKDLQSVAKHWMRIGGNLPRWIGANCGPENLRETFKKGSRRFRYWARRFLSQGKNVYRFEDEFGARRSHDDRHEILSRIFQGFNAYRPEPYGDRVTLFRASVRPLLHSLSPDLGWSSVTQKVRVHRIPGDHNTIIESAGLHRISDLILSSENCSPDA